LYLLRPSDADHVWAIAECLRCRGVAAVVASPPRLSHEQNEKYPLFASALI
jgi:hypothetical protein